MLNRIEDAILDIKNGKMVITVDDENRENEGDIILAGEKVSYDAINFMATHCRGLICVPITEERAKELELDHMVQENTDSNGTAFTVSVDSLEGTTTGISIGDRLKTAQELGNGIRTGKDFKKPGHMFPLIAKKGGVLVRNGHTEAAVDMARLGDLKVFAKEHGLKIISIEDLIKYRKKHDNII